MKSIEIMWNQLKSQVKSNEIKWNQMKSSEFKWDKMKSSEIKWDPPLPPQSLLSNFSWPYRYIREREREGERLSTKTRATYPPWTGPQAWAWPGPAGPCGVCFVLICTFSIYFHIFCCLRRQFLCPARVPAFPRSRAPLHKYNKKQHVCSCNKQLFFEIQADVIWRFMVYKPYTFK